MSKSKRSEADFQLIFTAMQAINDKWLTQGINFVTYMQHIDNNYLNYGWTPNEYHEAITEYIKKQRDNSAD